MEATARTVSLAVAERSARTHPVWSGSLSESQSSGAACLHAAASRSALPSSKKGESGRCLLGRWAESRVTRCVVGQCLITFVGHHRSTRLAGLPRVRSIFDLRSTGKWRRLCFWMRAVINWRSLRPPRCGMCCSSRWTTSVLS